MASRRICHCLKVTEGEVQAAVEVLGCRTLCQIKQETGAGTGCTACHRRIANLLRTADTIDVPSDAVDAASEC